MIMSRLKDMTDPSGQEYRLMRDRERLRAARLLVRFGRLVLAQVRWDRQVETSPQPFDWAAGVAWAARRTRKRSSVSVRKTKSGSVVSRRSVRPGRSDAGLTPPGLRT